MPQIRTAFDIFMQATDGDEAIVEIPITRLGVLIDQAALPHGLKKETIDYVLDQLRLQRDPTPGAE